jgi:hypothetical protein
VKCKKSVPRTPFKTKLTTKVQWEEEEKKIEIIVSLVLSTKNKAIDIFSGVVKVYIYIQIKQIIRNYNL